MNKWFYRLFVWLFGVRFYQSTLSPSKTAVLRTVFQTYEGKQIVFKFHRETYNDIVYRFGRFKKVSQTVIIVHGNFDVDDPHPVLRFNDTKFTFRGRWFCIDDQTLCDVLLGVYLDHLQSNVS